MEILLRLQATSNSTRRNLSLMRLSEETKTTNTRKTKI